MLFVMKMRKNLYRNSEESIRKYGKTYMCSNDVNQLKFMPVWFPIKGNYNDYGGIENIQRDANVEVIEKHYGLDIQQICDIITSGRKSDGFDDSLDIIKDKRYSGRDEDGRLKAVYKKKYEELLSLSGMWIHGEVYKRLVENPTGDYFDKIDLGNSGLLEALGFTKSKAKSGDDRYTELWTKGKVEVMSDGTWISVKDYKYGIYNLKVFKEYCEAKGESLDISVADSKDATEQLIDYILPGYSDLIEERTPLSEKELKVKMKHLEMQVKNGLLREDLYKPLCDLIVKENKLPFKVNRTAGPEARRVLYKFLNGDDYNIVNPMTPEYIKAALDGKLRQEVVEFWRFDHYLYVTGTFYDIVGTGPQDGEWKAVKKVIDVSKSVIDERCSDYDEEDE